MVSGMAASRTRIARPAQVRGRLAVGHDQHHGIVLGPPVKEPPGQHQRMMQVGALDHVPAEPGKIGLA